MDLSVDARIASIGPFAPAGGAPALVALAGGSSTVQVPAKQKHPVEKPSCTSCMVNFGGWVGGAVAAAAASARQILIKVGRSMIDRSLVERSLPELSTGSEFLYGALGAGASWLGEVGAPWTIAIGSGVFVGGALACAQDPTVGMVLNW